jgi:hypothetical protein
MGMLRIVVGKQVVDYLDVVVGEKFVVMLEEFRCVFGVQALLAVWRFVKR